MHKDKWIASFLTLILLGCAGTPATYYYTLHVPPPQAATKGSGPALGIEPLTADPLYAGYKLVYQSSPYTVQFYNYHQWAVEPAGQVTRAIANYLAHSGRFSCVATLPGPTTTEFRLRGRIVELGEWDNQDRWFGRVRIAFELVRERDQAVLWQGELSRSIPAESRNPESVVKALSRAIAEIAEEAQSQILATIASQE